MKAYQQAKREAMKLAERLNRPISFGAHYNQPFWKDVPPITRPDRRLDEIKTAIHQKLGKHYSDPCILIVQSSWPDVPLKEDLAALGLSLAPALCSRFTEVWVVDRFADLAKRMVF
jgi:hypothetical protein